MMIMMLLSDFAEKIGGRNEGSCEGSSKGKKCDEHDHYFFRVCIMLMCSCVLIWHSMNREEIKKMEEERYVFDEEKKSLAIKVIFIYAIIK